MTRIPNTVREVANDLKKSTDPKSKIMQDLTPDGEHHLYSDLARMWNKLLEKESKSPNTNHQSWILRFIDDVFDAKNPPKHSFLSAKEREELIQRIREHTKALKQIHTSYDLDDDIISNDGQFFYGFQPHDGGFIGFGKEGNKDAKPRAPSKVLITETLDFFEDRAIEKIQTAARRGKSGKGTDATKFIREMGERNEDRYRDPLLDVIQTLTNTIYRTSYDIKSIRSALKDRRKRE